jgi:hypothetical protein
MATGDINGDLPQTYEQRRQRQTAYDITNFPVGPVGRASQQLAAPPAAAAQVVPSLAAIPVAATVAPAATVAATATPQQPAGLNSIPAISISNPFRSTGIGGGAAGGAIVARQAPNGPAEFTNLLGAQAQAASLANISPSAPAAGSLSNLGDGVGTFSQGQAGDAALANQRFSRAAEIRQDTRNQQRLDSALANQASLDNITVVRDSSRPVTRDDVRRATLDQEKRAASLDQIGLAQGVIVGTQGQRAVGAQARQAARLEDIQARAYAPNATASDRDALAAVMDPTGKNRADVTLSQAKADQARAAAAKDNAEAVGATPEARQKAELNRLEIEKRTTDATTAAQTAATQKQGSIDIARRARDLAQAIPTDPQFNKITGTVDSMTPTLVGDSQDLVNRANQLQTLLTADNLKLMTGVLTDKDIAFLTQIGSGLNVTKNGINGSEDGARKTLSDITGRLNQKIADYEKANPAPAITGPTTATETATAAQSPAAGPTVGQVQGGYVFQGGDPASPSSWRKI